MAHERASVKDLPATEQAYHGIRDLILHHGLRPGERTSIALLAERLELGRTPVKEAVTRLTSEGLLIVHDRRGTYVNEPDEKHIVDMFEMRCLLEGYAAREAVEKVDPANLAALEGLLSRLEEESLRKEPSDRSMSRFLEADVYFHRRIIDLVDNDALSRMYAGMNLDLQIGVYLQRHVPAMAAARHQEHVRMVEALRQRDGALLEEILRDHARAVEQVVIASLRSR